VTVRTVDRRWAAAVGLVAVLLGAVIVALAGKTYPGSPVAAPPPPPPQVGDCVLDPVVPPWEIMGRAADSEKDYSYPRLTTGPCTGSRYGEIASVIADPAKPVVSDNSVDDPNLANCSQAARQYMGVPDDPSGSTPLQPVLFVGSAATSPSVRQEAAGEHWLGCIAYLEPHAFYGGGFDDEQFGRLERYDTTLRDAMTTGSQKDRTAMCVTGPLEQMQEVADCTSSHSGEILALGPVATASESRGTLTAACRDLIARRTGIPDPAAVGLTPQFAVTDENGARTDADPIPASSQVYCGLVATDDGRQLVGSLVLLGDRPVPWVS
jgi:hypothetical protein